MLSLIRNGPKIIILESHRIGELKDYLKSKFNTLDTGVNKALEHANETSTVIFFTKEMKEIIRLQDIVDVLVIYNLSDIILSSLFNEKKYDFISKIRIAPRIIVMKTFGDILKVINEVRNDYKGIEGSFESLLEENNNGTVITFTESNINKPLSLENIHEKALYVNKKFPELIKDLKIHDLKYLNIGLDKKDWYELKIKIYDSYGEYSLHYKRLIKVIEELDLGIVLGERWGTDTALVFLSVEVYSIRFFTFYDPEYVKKILLGLEHLEDGTRIVDIDLFHKKKKIHWSDLRERKGRTRMDLSSIYRQGIFSKLNTEIIEELLEFEREIVKGREKNSS